MRDAIRTLRIVERVADGITILDLTGRLVLDEGDVTFRDRIVALAAAGRRRLIVNLKDVTYIDSAGVGVMVAQMLKVRRAGGDMKLLNLTARSSRVMTITKLLTVFEAFDDEQEAIQSFRAAV